MLRIMCEKFLNLEEFEPHITVEMKFTLSINQSYVQLTCRYSCKVPPTFAQAQCSSHSWSAQSFWCLDAAPVNNLESSHSSHPSYLDR